MLKCVRLSLTLCAFKTVVKMHRFSYSLRLFEDNFIMVSANTHTNIQNMFVAYWPKHFALLHLQHTLSHMQSWEVMPRKSGHPSPPPQTHATCPDTAGAANILHFLLFTISTYISFCMFNLGSNPINMCVCYFLLMDSIGSAAWGVAALVPSLEIMTAFATFADVLTCMCVCFPILYNLGIKFIFLLLTRSQSPFYLAGNQARPRPFGDREREKIRCIFIFRSSF